MIFLIPQYFSPNLTNPARHGVPALIGTPKTSHYVFGRRRNSNQSDPANGALSDGPAIMKAWAMREKIVEWLLPGARRRPAGWRLMENDFEYFLLHSLCQSTVRLIRNCCSESGFVLALAGSSPLTTKMRWNGFARSRVVPISVYRHQFQGMYSQLRIGIIRLNLKPEGGTVLWGVTLPGVS
jgi:hypothetical protein